STAPASPSRSPSRRTRTATPPASKAFNQIPTRGSPDPTRSLEHSLAMEDRELHSMVAADDRHWWYRGRRRIVLSQLDRLPLPQAAVILDAGCGSCRMLDELERHGMAFGLDSSAWAVAAARARGHSGVMLGTVEHMPYPDGTFDLVTCLDVLEHTADHDR